MTLEGMKEVLRHNAASLVANIVLYYGCVQELLESENVVDSVCDYPLMTASYGGWALVIVPIFNFECLVIWNFRSKCGTGLIRDVDPLSKELSQNRRWISSGWSEFSRVRIRCPIQILLTNFPNVAVDKESSRLKTSLNYFHFQIISHWCVKNDSTSLTHRYELLNGLTNTLISFRYFHASASCEYGVCETIVLLCGIFRCNDSLTYH